MSHGVINLLEVIAVSYTHLDVYKRQASLDVENETLVQEAVSNMVRNKTVLIIAHRMRTVAGADRIIVLKDGCVAEQGTPEDLMERRGIYHHMAELQSRSLSWSCLLYTSRCV